MAAHRLGQVEAYLIVREDLSEASTASDAVLSRERSGFYRYRYAKLGLTLCSLCLCGKQEKVISVEVFRGRITRWASAIDSKIHGRS